MAARNSVSYLREITAAQDVVNFQLERVARLEKRLNSMNEDSDFDEDERQSMEKELSEVKKEVLDKQQQLKEYYGENRSTFMFAVLLMFFSFLFYGIYNMVVGPKL